MTEPGKPRPERRPPKPPPRVLRDRREILARVPKLRKIKPPKGR